MKRKWRFLLAVILTVAAAGIFCFRDALMVRLFPKIVLSKAIGETCRQLDERYADSPIHLLTNALDPDGCQQVSMKLDTGTQFMGIAHYNLELDTQTAPNRIRGQGTVSTGGGIMDLELYLDENFGAVSSESLTGGSFYGITYDTFAEDIRGYQLLTFLAGEEVLTSWDASVSGFAEIMRRSYTLPELSAEDIRIALMGTLALKPEVEAGEKGCYIILFRAEGDDVAEASEGYLSQAPDALVSLIRALDEDDASEVRIAFYLTDKKLTKVEATLTLNGGSYQISAEFHTEGVLDTEFFLYNGENLKRTDVTVKTVSDTETYQESIQLKRTINGVQSRLSLEYTWDLSSGDMVLNLQKDGNQYPIRLNLTGEGHSFTVTSQEFEQILSIISGKENPEPAICTLTVSPGEPVDQVPEYRNLSEWSMDDFWLLLERIGSLVGIKLP